MRSRLGDPTAVFETPCQAVGLRHARLRFLIGCDWLAGKSEKKKFGSSSASELFARTFEA
jgi:hypothetical protein